MSIKKAKVSETYTVQSIWVCQSTGLQRIAEELNCNLRLECDQDGKPEELIINDFSDVEDLHAKLGAYIQMVKAEKASTI